MFFPRIAGVLALVALVPAIMAAPAPADPPASPPAPVDAAAAPSPPPSDEGAPPPPPPAPADEADSQPPPPPPSSKIVTRINCTDFRTNGTLKLDDRPVGFDGSPGTLTLMDNGVPMWFVECSSETMGHKPDGPKHYGLLSPAAAPTAKCVSAEALGKANAALIIQDCSLSDDSSQMSQTFEYDDHEHTLTFVGRPAPGDFYQFNLVNNVTVAVSPDGSTGSHLQLA